MARIQRWQEEPIPSPSGSRSGKIGQLFRVTSSVSDDGHVRTYYIAGQLFFASTEDFVTARIHGRPGEECDEPRLPEADTKVSRKPTPSHCRLALKKVSVG